MRGLAIFALVFSVALATPSMYRSYYSVAPPFGYNSMLGYSGAGYMGGSSMIGGSMGYGSMMPLMSYSPMMSPMGYSGMNSMGYSMMNQGYSMMNPMGSMQYGSMPGYATGLSMGYGPPLAYSSAYGVYPGASYSSILPFGYRSLGYRRRPYLLSPYSYYKGKYY